MKSLAFQRRASVIKKNLLIHPIKRNELPLALSWTKRSMGFDYFDDFTDTFIVQNDFVAPSSVKPGKIIFYLSNGGFWLQPTVFHFDIARKGTNPQRC